MTASTKKTHTAVCCVNEKLCANDKWIVAGDYFHPSTIIIQHNDEWAEKATDSNSMCYTQYDISLGYVFRYRFHKFVHYSMIIGRYEANE